MRYGPLKKFATVGSPLLCGWIFGRTMRTIADGLIVYRKGNRSGAYVIDYSDDGGATWELAIVSLGTDETSIIRTIDASPAGYRDEIRGTSYCIDYALTPTGFAGIENTDWENIYKI